MDSTNERQWGYTTHIPNTTIYCGEAQLGSRDLRHRSKSLVSVHISPATSRLVIHHADWHSVVKGQPLSMYDQVLVFGTLQFGI